MSSNLSFSQNMKNRYSECSIYYDGLDILAQVAFVGFLVVFFFRDTSTPEETASKSEVIQFIRSSI